MPISLGLEEGCAVPRLLLFSATWASPVCAQYEPVVATVAQRLGLDLRVVDVDAEPNEARARNVLNIPSVALDTDTTSIPGARSAEDLEGLLAARLRDIR